MNEAAAGPVIWVRGKRAALGPLRADLVSRHWEWENEPRAILGYGRQVPDSPENRIDGRPCDELTMDAVPEDYTGPSHFSA